MNNYALNLGNNLVLDYGEQNAQVIVSGACLARWNIEVESPLIETFPDCIGGYREFTPGLKDCTVNLTFRGGAVSHMQGPPIHNDINKMSVLEIMQYLEERIKIGK